MARLIIINGVALSGKDTFAEFLKKICSDTVEYHSTIQTVKDAAKHFGADEEVAKGDEERLLWCEMKDLYTKYNNGPFNEVLAHMAMLDVPGKHPILIAMVREPEEITKLKRAFGLRCLTILVTRAEDIHIPDNDADKNVANYPYDIEIRNDSNPETLKLKARTVADYLNATRGKFLDPWL